MTKPSTPSVVLLLSVCLCIVKGTPFLTFFTDEVSSTTARISWISPSNFSVNGTVASFTIQLIAVGIIGEVNVTVTESQTANTLASCLVGSMANQTLTVPGNTTSTTLRDLTPFTSYEVHISEEAEINATRTSISLNFTTKESIPSRPQNLTASSPMDNAVILNVTWAAPLCDNGVRTQYSIDYFPIESDGVIGSPHNVTNLSADATSLTLTSLTPNTAYNVTVRAWTVNGPGDPSTVIGKTGDKAFEKVLTVTASIDDITATTARINWILPNNLSTNGTLGTFVINVIAVKIGILSEANVLLSNSQTANTLASCLVGRMANQTLTVPGNTTSATLRDLTPFTRYEVHISWYNEINAVKASNKLNFSTEDSTPGKPRNLIVVNSHTTSLIVTWEAPLCDNGIRTQYSIDYFPIESDGVIGSPHNVTNLSADATSLTLTSLTPNTAYNVTVRAWTVNGPGDPSTVIGTTEDYGVAVKSAVISGGVGLGALVGVVITVAGSAAVTYLARRSSQGSINETLKRTLKRARSGSGKEAVDANLRAGASNNELESIAVY